MRQKKKSQSSIWRNKSDKSIYEQISHDDQRIRLQFVISDIHSLRNSTDNKKRVTPKCIPLHQKWSRSVIFEADDICSRHNLNVCYTLHVHLTIAYDRSFRLFIFSLSTLFSVNVVNLSSFFKLLLWSNLLHISVVTLAIESNKNGMK